MRQLRNTFTSILLAVSMILTTAGSALTAWAGDMVMDGTENINYTVSSPSNNYDKWSTTIKTYLFPLDDGQLMTANYGRDGSNAALLIGYYNYDPVNGTYTYDPNAAKTIGLEFPLFGGIYATENYYFILTAQYNREQNNDKTVFRITRFDKDWTDPSPAELTNCNSIRPFAFGSARMETCGDYLLVRTCREMYKSYDGRNHQSNLTIQLNMNTMKITSSSAGYVSHSFNQFIKAENDRMITIDHGDAYPRGIILRKYNGSLSNGSIGGFTSVRPLTFKGASGNITTNATVGGFEISDSSYLIAGNSIDQSAESAFNVRNIFVAAVDKVTNEVTFNWLTTDTEGGTRTPHLVKINNNEYLVLWQKSNDIIYCAKVDRQGKLITENSAPGNNTPESGSTPNTEAKNIRAGNDAAGSDNTGNPPVLNTDSIAQLPGNLSDCAPVVVSSSSLMWSAASTANKDTTLKLYQLNLQALKGASTVSSSAMTITTTDNVKYPLSTVKTVDDSTYNNKEEPDDASDKETGSSSGSTGGSSGSSGNSVSVNQPFLQDSSGRQGWDVIIAEAEKAAAAPEGGTVSVNMNGTYLLPRRVLESIRGKNTLLVLDMGGGIRWRVYGKDITTETFRDTNLSLRTGTNNIPQSVADEAANGLEYLTLTLSHTGKLGFPLTLSTKISGSSGLTIGNKTSDKYTTHLMSSSKLKQLTIGNGTSDKYADMYANLFYYNAALHRLEFISVDKIGKDGTVNLAFTCGADHMIIVSPQPMGSTNTPQEPDPEKPEEGDTPGPQPENPQKPDENTPIEVKSVELSKTVYTYNGKAKKPSVTVVDTEDRQISSEYYTVSYKNNKKVGRATAIITFNDGDTDAVEKTFTIRPAATSVKKTTALAKGFTLKWKKKTTQTSGYQIQYSTKSGFKGNSTNKVLIKKTSVDKKTIKNLKAGKKYYVRIRTYKTVKIDGKNTKIYSPWSTAEKIQTLSAASTL